VKTHGKNLIFTSDLNWDVSLASDFISENSWEKCYFHKWFHLRRVTGTWQAIRKTSIRNKWNPVGLRKIFIWIFTCENADIPYNFLYGASLVLHLCKRTCPTGFTRWFTSETFFLNWRAVTLVTNTNNQSFYTVRIRDILNRHQPKIILLWIPGNDTSDLAAKEAHNKRSPQVMECNYNFTDTQLFIKNTFKKQMESIWQNASDHYKYVNEKKWSIKDYTIPSEDNINRRDLTKFLRLRFGHSRYTHEHVLNKQPPPQCEHCGTRNNVRHFFLSIKSPDALSPKSTNIASANDFIKAIRLYNNI